MLRNKIQDKALEYRKNGLNILPAWKETKRPSTTEWRTYQNEFYDGKYKTDAICLVCGTISGNVEVIDFDYKAVDFDKWFETVKAKDNNAENLVNSLIWERTQSGGLHIGYRCDYIEPTQKLCLRQKDNTYISTIETRSEGSIVLIAPSNGYELIKNDWANIPYISKEERDILIETAREISDKVPAPPVKKAPAEFKDIHKDTAELDVANYLREDDSSRRLLTQFGWEFLYEQGDKEYWKRPGKRQGVSASLDKETGMVYCFTSNAYPLEQNMSYTPLQLLATLEYNGDVVEASREVMRNCKTDDEQVYERPFSLRTIEPDNKKKSVKKEYNNIYEIPFADCLLNPGGYLEAIMDYTDVLSMRKQRRLAFGAAITSLGHIMSRRIVYKYSGLTPALYTIGISPPSSGKSSGRIATQKIFALDPTGLCSQELIESIESVQALQSAIQAYKKCFLMQDEFGGWLTATMRETANGNKSRIIDEVLKLFSESNNPHYVPRITAGNFKPQQAVTPVEYPSFSMYGATNLLELQTALNERLLKNGFIARVLFIAGENESKLILPTFEEMQYKQEREVPEGLNRFFQSLLKFHQTNNLTQRTPPLFPVDISPDAYEYIREYALMRDNEYLSISEVDSFDLKVFKGRSLEKTIKYALNFAVSKYGADEDNLIIDSDVAFQAVELSKYEHKLYEFLAKNEIVSNEFDRKVVNVEQWLRTLKEETFSKSTFTTKFRNLNLQDRYEVLKTLEDKGIIESELVKTSGRPKYFYRINRNELG